MAASTDPVATASITSVTRACGGRGSRLADAAAHPDRCGAVFARTARLLAAYIRRLPCACTSAQRRAWSHQRTRLRPGAGRARTRPPAINFPVTGRVRETTMRSTFDVRPSRLLLAAGAFTLTLAFGAFI